MTTSFDTIVIGGGPGGYVAAIRAAQLGLKTALIEKEHLGGICLNWGCIPTKALLRTAELYHLMKRAEEFGLQAENISFDLSKIVQRSRNVANQLSKGISHLLKKNKVTVFEGHGSLLGKGNVKVSNKGKDQTLSAKSIILATGARAREVSALKPDGARIVTYKAAMTPEEMPKKILVVGSGAIGMEFASFYNQLGADVTVVELMDRILPQEDVEVSEFCKKSFEKQGMTILTKANVLSAKNKENEVEVCLEEAGKKTTLQVDRVISAIGIVANTENLGIEKTAIKLEKGLVDVDPYGETAEKGVYAIGDMTKGPWLAHKASHEGVIVAEKIAGQKPHPLNRQRIPGCTYTYPQVASIGLTEAKAIDAGYDLRVGRFPFVGNGKAIALGETEGFVKTIFDKKTGELLGAHMVGAEVTEMIQGYALAMNLETTEQELMETIFPHPTLSEMMHESVLDAYDKVIHF